jgi:hypothetical protein
MSFSPMVEVSRPVFRGFEIMTCIDMYQEKEFPGLKAFRARCTRVMESFPPLKSRAGFQIDLLPHGECRLLQFSNS